MHTARKASTLRAAVMLSAAALSLAIASPAAAQSKAVIVTAKSDPFAAEAAMKAEKALADRYLSAARHYRRAAQLHGNDAAAIANYRLAAWAYSAGGDNTAALRVMTRAGELAERVGDTERAVGSYVDAALLAKNALRADEVSSLMKRADVLLASSKLSAESRVALIERIEAQPALKGMISAR